MVIANIFLKWKMEPGQWKKYKVIDLHQQKMYKAPGLKKVF